MPTLLRTSMQSSTPIVVLNGASSSGKSTLARAMQALWTKPLHHVQLDAFREMEPPGYWDGWKSFPKEKSESMMSALCGAVYAAVAQYARHGQEVVLDVALTNPQARQMLAQDLGHIPVFLVGVHCEPDELARRETQRGNRKIGLAASQVGWLHKRMLYDLEVNTTRAKPEESAAEIQRWLSTGPQPSAISQLRAQLNAA